MAQDGRHVPPPKDEHVDGAAALAGVRDAAQGGEETSLTVTALLAVTLLIVAVPPQVVMTSLFTRQLSDELTEFSYHAEVMIIK